MQDRRRGLLSLMRSPRSARPVPRTFLFSDLRGYASYVERSGDAAASRLLRTYRAIVRRAIAREKGAEIKTEGDSFYVVFSSSGDAVRCAVAIQRAAARRPGEELAIGIGIHAGEVVPFDRQYVGSAVNIASRLASAAAPGEILVSETVRSLIRTAVRFPFDERGPLTLKGITEPIRVYAIGGVDRPQPTHVETAPTRPMEAVARGDLDGAAQIVRAMRQQASANEHCDALAALAIVAATRGDVEMALGRTEQMLPLALRAAEASWVRAAYALRAWLYSLARQPGEARAELARAHQRPGESSDACLLMLVAVTMEGSAAHAGHLRRIASACPERSWGGACAVVADALEGRLDAGAAYNAVAGAGAPFMAALVGFQLASRAGETGEREFQATIARSGGSRLAELILAARQ